MEQQLLIKQAEAKQLLNYSVFCPQKGLNFNSKNCYHSENKIPITPILDFRQQPLFYIVENVDSFYDTLYGSLANNNHQKQSFQQQKLEQQVSQENPPIHSTVERKNYTDFFIKKKPYLRQKKIFTFGLKKLTQAMESFMSESVQSVYTYKGIIENILSSFDKQISQKTQKTIRKRIYDIVKILAQCGIYKKLSKGKILRNHQQVSKSMGNSKLEQQLKKKSLQNKQRQKQLLQKYQVYCNLKTSGVKISPQFEQLIIYCQNKTSIVKVENL